MLRLIYFFVLFVSVSCARNYPSWYLSVNNNSDVLIGNGSANNFENATTKALGDISLQIKSTISSSAKTVDNSNSYGLSYSTFGQNSSVDSDQIAIKNYTVKHKEIFANANGYDEHLVQVMVLKRDVIAQQKTDADTILVQIQAKLAGLSNYNLLEQRKHLKEMLVWSKTMMAKVNVIRGLDERFDGMPYFRVAQDLQLKFDNILKKISFYIETDNQDIKNAIAAILANENITNLSSKNYNQNTVVINVKYGIVNSKFGINFISKVAMNISLLDSNESVSKTSQINVAGSSVISQEEATKNAINNLANKIKSENIESVLGL
ncbi:MAG: hypothetical protein RL208_737 [Pseudomonadota bacterium]|jgi:hypothetical protein